MLLPTKVLDFGAGLRGSGDWDKSVTPMWSMLVVLNCYWHAGVKKSQTIEIND